jgi:hypothetical protein
MIERVVVLCTAVVCCSRASVSPPALAYTTGPSSAPSATTAPTVASVRGMASSALPVRVPPPAHAESDATLPKMTELVLLHDAARDVVVRLARDACARDEAASLTIEVVVKGQVRDGVVVATQREPASCSDLGRTVEIGDFNFDGYGDLAVPVDNAGPYGGRTYAILLFHPATGHYAEAPALSALTRENLGLFAVDTQIRRLTTFNKSGCCIHSKNKFAVVRDEPILLGGEVESVIDEADHCYVVLKRTDENGKSRSTRRACTKDELR